MSLPTHVEQSDIDLFTRARRAFEQGQTIMNFTSAHLGEKYQMGRSDSFDEKTGAITRAEAPAQDPNS